MICHSLYCLPWVLDPGSRRISSGDIAWFDDGWDFAYARAPAWATDFRAAACSNRFDYEGYTGAKGGQDRREAGGGGGIHHVCIFAG